MKHLMKGELKGFSIVFAIFILLTLVISVLSIQAGVKAFWGRQYTFYNNYVIFKSSFANLIENVNLYDFHPNQYADLYKYSPTFALFMGFFALLPDWLGLFAWELLNTVVFILGLKKLSFLSTQQKNVLLLFCVFELIVSLQNHQSNLLIMGLLFYGLDSHLKGHTVKAFTFIFLTVLIKLFSIVLLPLLFLKPITLKQFLQCFTIALVLALLPIIVIGPTHLFWQYQNWYTLLQNDYGGNPGHSIHGIVQDVLGLTTPKMAINIIGLGLLVSFWGCLLLIQANQKHVWYFVFACLWMIVFNHKAESPTFIVAVSAAILWFLVTLNKTKAYIFGSLFVIFTSLISTDVFPVFMRKEYFEPWHIKVFASTLLLFCIWFTVIYKVINTKKNTMASV